MKDVNLSKRMEAVVNMVSPQSFTIADVGCDHAYVSIALISRHIAKKVVAMDVRTGPLSIAKRNVEEAGYTGDIDIRLGDGLEQLRPGKADTIIIAGMGGLLIKGILERGEHILHYKEKQPVLILQPQSDLKEVRMFLYQQGYCIVKETMLVEDGKCYTVMKAEPVAYTKAACLEMDSHDLECCDAEYDEEEWVYGRYNLMNRSEVLFDYLQKERDVLKRILNRIESTVEKASDKEEMIPESTRKRMESIKQEILINHKALQYFQ